MNEHKVNNKELNNTIENIVNTLTSVLKDLEVLKYSLSENDKFDNTILKGLNVIVDNSIEKERKLWSREEKIKVLENLD